MSVKDNSYGLAPLQDKMLDILKYFIGVCEKNGLRYCLAGGTCLGALRHQGFIPWDDDLDVYMPRDDYEKLWTLMKNSIGEERYKLCRTDREKNYHHRVMQIVDLSTTFIHERSKDEDIEHGVYIDIIPLDACPNNRLSRVCQKVNAILFSIYNIQCKPEYNGGKLTGIIKICTDILLTVVKNPERRYKIWKKAEKRMTKYSWDSADKCIVITSTFHELMTPIPKEWFKKRVTKFEDIKAVVPLEAEAFCKAMHGDYMRLPPVESRVARHHTVLIDLDNSYTKYKGKYYCVNSAAE